MLKRSFYKYQGAGNDFILFDDRENSFNENDSQFIELLCNRRFGIGADGLMLLRNSKVADFEMIYFNSDGKIGSMCGNGGRCIVRFAQDLKVINRNTTFEAIDGLHDATIENEIVHLKMIDVHSIKKIGEDLELDTGSPHYIHCVEELNIDDFVESARLIRNSNTYKEKGININFISFKNDKIDIRTYERGVEDETLACGTGITAAAISYAYSKNKFPKQYLIPVKSNGEELSVRFNQIDSQSFKDVWLIGPAKFVFKGEIEIDGN